MSRQHLSLTGERTIAILCAAQTSVYKTIPHLDLYDIARDARTFTGNNPVIAHPPCRLWSAFCRHQAKPEHPEQERDLARFCVAKVRSNGGILEQPAHSRLWEDQHLPYPGPVPPNTTEFSIELPQFWFGDSREKNTWLYFVGITIKELPPIPFRLKPQRGDRRTWQLMPSKHRRERTPLEFAQWLVTTARLTYKQT